MYLSEHILVAGVQCVDNNYVSFINNIIIYNTKSCGRNDMGVSKLRHLNFGVNIPLK